MVMSFEEEKQVKLQFVLCVHYKHSTWGMVHTADMWVLGQLLGGQLHTQGFFLKPTTCCSPRFTPQPVSAGIHGVLQSSKWA